MHSGVGDNESIGLPVDFNLDGSFIYAKTFLPEIDPNMLFEISISRALICKASFSILATEFPEKLNTLFVPENE